MTSVNDALNISTDNSENLIITSRSNVIDFSGKTNSSMRMGSRRATDTAHALSEDTVNDSEKKSKFHNNLAKHLFDFAASNNLYPQQTNTSTKPIQYNSPLNKKLFGSRLPKKPQTKVHPQSNPVALQNVNLIQFNSIAQPMNLNNSLGLLAKCLAKNNSQRASSDKDIVTGNSVKSIDKHSTIRVPEQQIFDESFNDFMKAIGIRLSHHGIMKAKIRLFLSFSTTIQFGCPKFFNEYLFCKSRARAQFLTFICLKFSGIDVNVEVLEPLLTSESVEEMCNCLFLFMVLFERYVSLNITINSKLKKESNEKREAMYAILLGIENLKKYFLTPQSLEGFAFVEKFKQEYSRVWDRMIAYCGQKSPFIETVNGLSRVAFLLVKQQFMLSIFKGGQREPKVVPPVKLPPHLLIKKAFPAGSNSMALVPQMKALTTVMVIKLVQSVSGVVTQTPSYPPVNYTETPVSHRMGQFKRPVEHNPRTPKQPRLMTFPQVQQLMRSQMQGKSFNASPYQQVFAHPPSFGSSSAKRVAQTQTDKKTIDIPEDRKTWLEDKVHTMDKIVKSLNSRLDELLSTAQFCVEQLDSK